MLTTITVVLTLGLVLLGIVLLGIAIRHDLHMKQQRHNMQTQFVSEKEPALTWTLQTQTAQSK